MSKDQRLTKLLCIVGPTATGKSQLGIELAQKFNGEIINADSRQFYSELKIGTAKPNPSELSSVPHHLIDCATILEPWSVARFISEAQIIIHQIHLKNKLPILVGGTGLYVQSLLYGLDKMPQISEQIRMELQKNLQNRGLEALYRELEQIDPDSAKKLSPNDSYRIIRALEVFKQTGKPIHSYWQTNNERANYDYIKLALSVDRKILYQKTDERVCQMIHRGLKEEAQNLVSRFPDNLILEKTIGYAEWLKYGFDQDDFVLSKIQQNTRNFAKRQLTWFRNESDVNWYSPIDTDKLDVQVKTFLLC